MLKKISFYIVAILVMLATAALAFASFMNHMALPSPDDIWGHTGDWLIYLVIAGFMILPEAGFFSFGYLLAFNEKRTRGRITTWIAFLVVSTVFIVITTIPFGLRLWEEMVNTDFAGLR